MRYPPLSQEDQNKADEIYRMAKNLLKKAYTVDPKMTAAIDVVLKAARVMAGEAEVVHDLVENPTSDELKAIHVGHLALNQQPGGMLIIGRVNPGGCGRHDKDVASFFPDGSCEALGEEAVVDWAISELRRQTVLDELANL